MYQFMLCFKYKEGNNHPPSVNLKSLVHNHNKPGINVTPYQNQLGRLVLIAFAPCLGGPGSIPGRVKLKISNGQLKLSCQTLNI